MSTEQFRIATAQETRAGGYPRTRARKVVAAWSRPCQRQARAALAVDQLAAHALPIRPPTRAVFIVGGPQEYSTLCKQRRPGLSLPRSPRRRVDRPEPSSSARQLAPATPAEPASTQNTGCACPAAPAEMPNVCLHHLRLYPTTTRTSPRPPNCSRSAFGPACLKDSAPPRSTTPSCPRV